MKTFSENRAVNEGYHYSKVSELHASPYSYGDNSSKPRRTNQSLSKKALFFTSVLFYWAIFFKIFFAAFNPVLFAFVIVFSLAFSSMGSGWGIINNIAGHSA